MQIPLQPLYFYHNTNSNLPFSKPQSINTYELRKNTSKKLDLLYEECLNKSNRILEENETKLQQYLSQKRTSTAKANLNKENFVQSPKKQLLLKPDSPEKKPFTLSTENQKVQQSPKNYKNPEVIQKKSEDELLKTIVFNEESKPEIRENIKPEENSKEVKLKNIELRLQLDELFEKCTKKTKQCLENNISKTESLTNIPLIQTKFLEDGSFYRGFLHDGLRCGDGVLYNPLGKEIYKGNWDNDEYHGQGILHLDLCGDFDETKQWISYEGKFINGKFEGLGKITMKNNEIILKNFKNGEVFDEEGKKDRLNTSLNKINEEEEKNSDNYEESLEQYFKEEFEMMENDNGDAKEIEQINGLLNDSNENLKDLSENICKTDEEEKFYLNDNDEYELEFI